MKLLREPLVHFLILGAVLFLLFSLVGDPVQSSVDHIVVSPGQITQLTEGWKRTWQRPPTKQELDGLIEDHIREEVYYREALAMGLDRDDTIVRRRLRQKLEFFTDDLLAAVDPTQEQLETYLNEHPDAFRVPSRVSFQQIYINRDRRGEQAAAYAEKLLLQLNQGETDIDAGALGDSSMLPSDYDLAPQIEVVRRLGPVFAAALPALPVGRWSGPVESGFGLHLVLIRQRQPASLPALAEVRETVEREWRVARGKEASEGFYQGLRQRYEVSIERPVDGGGEEEPALAETRR